MPPAWTVVILTLIAFVVGLTLPDLDLRLWLGHRSGLTHSVLPAVLLLARRRWHAAACGMGAGTGLHLAADSFPNRMIGYATVKLPVAGALSPGESYAWLGVNAVMGLALAILLLPRLHAPRAALLVAGVALAGGLAYLWRTDGGWPVLAIAAALAWLVWRMRTPARR